MEEGIIEDDVKDVDAEYQLKFELTERQQVISENLCQFVMEGNSVLLEAVCGAGKTELVYRSISEMLKAKKRVGFAIPRRQVVIEIAERLQSVFTKLKVVPVCQGYTKDVFGDVIVCTTHQLYRYNQYFDLLIIDEPDAFPFKGNEVLKGFAEKSCRGVKVFLSATPDQQLLSQVSNGELKYLYLPKRPTGRDMIVPEAYYLPNMMMYLYCVYRIWRLVQNKKQVLVFVPTIKMGRRFYGVMRWFFQTCYIDSKVENKDQIIRDFRSEKYALLISTSVLERGVTFAKINCLMLDCSNAVFDEASLVQMAGRVGRSVKDPYGECVFLSTARSEKIDKCIQRIERANND